MAQSKEEKAQYARDWYQRNKARLKEGHENGSLQTKEERAGVKTMLYHQQRKNPAWMQKEKERHKIYNAKVRLNKGRSSKLAVARGYVGESLVVADLTARCGVAYLNPMPQTKDDAFVKTSLGWYSVQIKGAKVRKTRRGLSIDYPSSVESTLSDLRAAIDPDRLLVRYRAGQKPLPPELPTDVSGTLLCACSAVLAAEVEV